VTDVRAAGQISPEHNRAGGPGRVLGSGRAVVSDAHTATLLAGVRARLLLTIVRFDPVRPGGSADHRRGMELGRRWRSWLLGASHARSGTGGKARV